MSVELSLRHRQGIQAAMAGINAGVVGILLSALYDPGRAPLAILERLTGRALVPA